VAGLVLFFFQNFGYRKVHLYNAKFEVSMISFRGAASPLAALAIIAIAAVAACEKTGTGNVNSVTPAVAQPATTASVTIDGYAFHPPTLRIEVGTTVKWTNHQNITHTVTANNGSFNSGDIAPGHSFSHMFTSAGKFPYHCMIHPFMHGTVIVTQ
jgi:plastocyanin